MTSEPLWDFASHGVSARGLKAEWMDRWPADCCPCCSVDTPRAFPGGAQQYPRQQLYRLSLGRPVRPAGPSGMAPCIRVSVRLNWKKASYSQTQSLEPTALKFTGTSLPSTWRSEWVFPR